MDELNLSAVTQSSASTNSDGEAFSFSGNESSTDMEVSFDVVEIPADSDAVTPTPAVNWNVMDDDQTGSIVFTVSSFPTNPTLSESETSMSTSLASPPKLVEVRRKSRRRRPILSGATLEGERSMHSGPYAQLYFDKGKKTVLAMLEIDIVNGSRKSHSRLPLEAPSAEDYFPWLHKKEREEGIDGKESQTWTWGNDKSILSAISGDQKVVEDNSDSSSTTSSSSSSSSQEDYCEPIILSGWMVDHDSMSDEEADIYWLLNDDKDVWVKIDDGCAKALRKLWKSYGCWKLLKRSPHLQQPGSPDDREEKRFRYSMLR